jgi:addiction module RelE/StbE family toxin
MNVTWSPEAIADLGEIADYLKARSPRGAAAVGERIEEVVSLLAQHPGIGRVLEQRPSVRVMPLGRYPYLVFYEVVGNELQILHIRHGARRQVEPDEL